MKRFNGRTQGGYESLLRNYLPKEFEDRPLRDITLTNIRDIIQGINKSATTKSHLRACLHKAFEDALEEGIVSSNPVDRARAPLRASGRSISPLSYDELQILLSAKSIEFYPLVATAATTGLRQGELLALQWANVDLKQGVIRVTRSLDFRNGQLKFKECKNHQNRSVRLLELTIQVLTEHFRSSYTNPEGLVFCRADGCALNSSVVTHSFSRSLKRCGLRHVRFHDLRHTHATQLLMAGVPVKVVQERLGHKSCQLTIDTYGHFMPGVQDEYIKQFDSRQRLEQETVGDDGANGESRTRDRRFTKPLLYH